MRAVVVDVTLLGKEERELAIEAIKGYWVDERDDEIGDLAAGILVDFIDEHIGPLFYNRAIEDAEATLTKVTGTHEEELELLKRYVRG